MKMNTKEAWAALLDGKKIRHRDWDEKCYLVIDQATYMLENQSGRNATAQRCGLYENTEDWEIVKETRTLTWDEIKKVVEDAAEEATFCNETDFGQLIKYIHNRFGFK